MTTFATLFSGGELAGVGMQAAGWRHLWGVEQDRAIAEVAHANGFGCVMVADVRGVCFEALDRPDHLHASPPCTRASVANAEAKESPLDGELAEAVCRAIRVLRPDTFTLENVYGYRRFDAYQKILRTLCEGGYEFQQHHLNAASFGVPQTRMRLILRASRIGPLRPLQPTHSARTEAQGLFDAYEPLPPWIGWYASIEDLIPTLPESAFAPWQLMRLPEELTGDFLHMTSNTQKANPTGTGCLEPDEPANTVTSADGARPRAFLVEGSAAGANNPFPLQAIPDDMPVFTQRARQNNPRAFLVSDFTEGSGASVGVRESAAPSATVRAMDNGGTGAKAFLCHGTSTLELRDGAEPAAAVMATVHAKAARPRAFIVDGKPANYTGDLSVRGSASETPTLTATQPQHPFRAWLSHGRVVSMTPRALARFQSVPDRYELPTNKKLACLVLGNGVPCTMMQRIAESLP